MTDLINDGDSERPAVLQGFCLSRRRNGFDIRKLESEFVSEAIKPWFSRKESSITTARIRVNPIIGKGILTKIRNPG